jgi:hypothetical protein
VRLSARKLQKIVKVSGATMLELWHFGPDAPLRIEGDTLSAVLMPVKVIGSDPEAGA